MLTFRAFVENEEKKNLAHMLEKLPPSHRSLVQGYRFKFQPGNTLDGDDQHVGYMDDESKEIAVAAPWNYGREFTILHEIGHRVWEKLPEQIHKAWAHVVAHTDKKQKQSPEELFCMAYANYYAKNKVVIHDHPAWKKFIANLPN